jgi:hypothetical protein
MNYPSIRIEGAILSPDIIDRLEDMAGQKPADFGLDSGGKVKDEIAAAWADAQDYWRIFQRKIDTLKPDVTATTETRNLWIVPLLRLLGYDLEFQKAGAEINGKTYAISHRITNRGNTPVHIVGLRDPAGLDRKPANATLRMSAHAVVQEFLNLDEQLYGLVTNGRMLRLLRDSSRLIKQSYLEFDLDRIFTDGLFADFAILYRLLHATRLPISSEVAAESLIERYHQDSLDSGARIREGLSAAVENAILTFGNGFLAHPANDTLRQRLASGTLTADDYYKSLLRLIYRLLFLMVIEERGLVFPDATTKRQRDTYMRFYSVQRLRNLSEKRSLADKRQNDLWLALLSTFRLFEAGGPGAKLGLKPLDGDLFRAEALGDLETSQLGNDALLTCLRSLGLYQHPTSKQLIRVNYAALNVEEFGSVYEGLLEYEPAVDTASGPVPTFAFKRGDERSATGSHYTPDDLVQPLIKHSLDHLIADRLKKPDPEKELLDLRVADIACGSGHILLAAARRIATELAIVRTGEEQPSPTAFRTALRDTIRSCIYGVDLNPLAVELCKVALWLEAHNPGEPLNFLDHRIKCGNAIVGYVRREEVDAGVPDEAFAKLPGDDPEVAKKIRARNKSERKSRDQKKFAFTKDRQGQIDAVLDKWKTIAAMPERAPEEIDAKKAAFDAFMSSGAAFVLKQIASIPIAQFYLPRTPENEQKIITDEAFREYWSGERLPQGQSPAAAVGIAAKKRFFHWFLEFPEIVQRGGFDCILGNPPYLGGSALSGTYGYEFCNWVKHGFTPTGLSELVCFFLRRYGQLLREGGSVGLITTNSVKDGDIRTDGLGYLTSNGAQITMAIRAVRWPGRAKLIVSLLSVCKGRWPFSCHLDGRHVEFINSYLEDSGQEADPVPLRSNVGFIYEGSKWQGDGFVVSKETASSIIAGHALSAEVVKRVLNADEVNSHPTQQAQRYAIYLADMSYEEASQYTGAMSWLATHVREERLRSTQKVLRDFWWRFERPRCDLYRGIRAFSQCMVLARHTKHFGLTFVPTDQVFSGALKVLTTGRWDVYAVLQSTIHESWARKYSGAIKQDLRYSPSNCFETYAFPDRLWQTPSAGLAEIGERYHEHRRRLMLSLWLGLTDVYNLFHSREVEGDLAKHCASRAKKDPRGESIPEEHRAAALSFTPERALAGILELRRLHVELDTAVRDAYGWHDLPLEHDFYEVETLPENDRVRYTISPATRKELLKRLLAENHRRAATESDQADAMPAAPTRKRSAKRSASAPSGPTLFAPDD